MKIIYIAPMFHTNQVPIVKGWLEHGHDVEFICHYRGKTENHNYCTPFVLGYSRIFKCMQAIYMWFCHASHKLSSYPEAFQDRLGFPSMRKLAKHLQRVSPDVVILRERSLYSICAYFVCRMLKLNCVLYNQTPLWDYEPPRNDLPHRIVKSLTPSIRMTPVFGNPDTGYLDTNTFYVPFVIDPHLEPSRKIWFSDGIIHLLCVGKYEERKHQLMLLQILNNLLLQYPLHLTLVGEMSTEYHQNYFQKIQAYISEYHLEGKVTCYTNCNPADMENFYRAADLFLLPSTGEFASISQLEAMSYSLPVVVSDTNGSACYIEDQKNGFLFRDNDAQDLEKKLEKLLSNTQAITEMGAYSYQLVTQKYSFRNYQENIEKLIALTANKKEN